MRHRRFDDPKWRIDVGFHRPVEIVGGYVENRFGRLLATRIADQYVQASQFTYGSAHQLPAEGLMTDVAGKGDGFAPRVPNQFQDFLSVGFFVGKIADGNIGSFSCVGYG